MTSTTTISGLPDASAPLHGAERLPMDDLVAGATRDASTLQIAQTLPDATTTSRGAMTAAQALKLAGIATGATVNATDAALRDRATHTGEQAIGTITGLSNALASKVSSVGLDTPAGQGLSVSNSPVNSSGTLVISVASGYQIPTTAQLASFLTSATAVTTYQPLDSDLTAIAALSTTSFGRGLLALADAAAGRTTLGLGTSSTPQFAGLGLTGGNLTARQAATQDAIIVSGRSGGNSSFSVTFIPATLTASQTLTAPNVSGTIVTTRDTGTVTSAMIANGTIVDADISNSAEIAVSKLADGNARQLLQTDAAGTGVEWTSNVDIPGTLDVTGATTLDSILSVPLGSATAPSIYPGTDTNTGIYSPGGDQLAFSTNGVERVELGASEVVFNDGGENYDFRIEGDTNSSLFFADASTDRVGIGTTSPGAILHIDQTSGGSSVIGAAIRNNSNSASTGVILDLTPSTASPGVRSAQLEAVNNGANQISFNLKLANAVDPITRFSLSPTGTATIFAAQGGVPFIANVGTSEVARIDSAGRLLIGASTVYTIGESNNWMLQASNSTGISNLRTGNDSSPSYLVLAKTKATSAGSFARVGNNDGIGEISFAADDGTDYATKAAMIFCQIDGTPDADDMPGRLVFGTTADGASSPTEALRITNDRVVAYNQAAPVSKSTAATLTIAELKGGIIQYTGNAQTLTLPTGTLSEGGFSGLYNNMTFQWSVINTGSGTCTVAGDTGHTVVGAGAVAAGSSGRFASRRTGANTFVTYRLS